jgi:hypothetical protein
MNRVATTVAFIALAATAIAAPEEKFVVSGFGGYAISRNITTLWLSGPHRHPILLVYFHGPDDWHKTLWNMNSRFGNGNQSWAELQSENATLRVEIDAEAGEARVQSEKFKIKEKNVFLVLHNGELMVPQKIIPLGFFDLQRSSLQPVSIRLLQAHPELIRRIKAEVSSGGQMSKHGKASRDRLLAPVWPCTEKRFNTLFQNGALVRAAQEYPTQFFPARILKSTYSIPCCGNTGSCSW